MSALALDMPSRRWTPARKETVCLAILFERATVGEVCAEYDLSAEEVAAWLERFDRHGRPGLATRKLQVVR